ncbi:MAG: hypothetical protein AB7G40_05530 [Hyphomonadaceae bacterium]
MTGNAYQQIETERKTRWARRDFSLHPLTDMEKAERRYHRLKGWWASLLWLSPLVAGAILGAPLGEWETPVLVAMTTFFAWALTLVMYLVAGWLLGEPSARVVFWISAIAIIVAGLGLFLLLLAVAAEAPLLSGLLVSALQPFWPFLWRRLRDGHPTDYERMLADAATPPQGIVE